jgi:hypothetical protein
LSCSSIRRPPRNWSSSLRIAAAARRRGDRIERSMLRRTLSLLALFRPSWGSLHIRPLDNDAMKARHRPVQVAPGVVEMTRRGIKTASGRAMACDAVSSRPPASRPMIDRGVEFPGVEVSPPAGGTPSAHGVVGWSHLRADAGYRQVTCLPALTRQGTRVSLGSAGALFDAKETLPWARATAHKNRTMALVQPQNHSSNTQSSTRPTNFRDSTTRWTRMASRLICRPQRDGAGRS